MEEICTEYLNIEKVIKTYPSCANMTISEIIELCSKYARKGDEIILIILLFIVTVIIFMLFKNSDLWDEIYDYLNLEVRKEYMKMTYRELNRKIKATSHNIKIYFTFDPKKHYEIKVLPNDMLKEITSYLFGYDKWSLRCVNKYLYGSVK